MSDLLRIRLKTLAWFLCFPSVFLIVVPWWLHRHVEGSLIWQGTLLQWVGVWLIVNGIGLGAWCVNLFNVEGEGTPIPLDPPKRFVVSGPYQFVRNPMAIGLFLMLGGQAMLYQSRIVFLYWLLIVALMNLFVRLVEEPDLARRFGPCYTAYKRQVPRWIPRHQISAAPKAAKR